MASQPSPAQIDALIDNLHALSRNLWWTWNHTAQEVFAQLSPYMWERSNHNPVEVLRWVSREELRLRLRDAHLHGIALESCREFSAYMKPRTTWVTQNAAEFKKSPVAYFSAEFGFHESLRIYSGGLGVLSGDHTKSASDLGLPFYGISLFYRQGYFQQQISNDGWQLEKYPAYDPSRLPITHVLDAKGRPVVCQVEIGNDVVKFQGWAINVGRATIFLLDTDLSENDQRYRDLTAHVYGGDQWTRISQEIVLGIGGIRFLRALGIAPAVFHMNEGHSAFLTLELLREQLKGKKALDVAEETVRKSCVFTTHTPVPAGHDRFDYGLMKVAFPAFCASTGLSVDQVMRYGRVRQDDYNEQFTMTVLALRMCHAANGVSKLHGRVSQEMWKELYPGVPAAKVPIGAVTNGVHIAGWTSSTAAQFWTERLGSQWKDKVNDKSFWAKALKPGNVTDEELWGLRTILRRELVEFARKRMREQSLRSSAGDVSVFDDLLSPDVLTVGIARRFATYKRAPLIFRDFDWALRTLRDENQPVQLIFSGKAHPRDDAGKSFIKDIVNIAKRNDLFGKIVFLEDYDINVARYMVAGCDVWLATPRRPMEASGTSGMKALIHGCLHMMTMDGWWREAYDGHNGWKVGEDTTAASEQLQDDLDGASLRAVFENDIIPLFYKRGKDGIPHEWLRRVRHAMISLIPEYNTHRMVQEYITKYYRQHAKK
ncbi:MAG: alpha-glucan family phosphorylase [Bacteroidota bacterium]